MNIAANFTKLGNLLTLKGNSISKEILTKAIQNQPIQGTIINKFELGEMPVDEQVIQSLLFYFGYLTIGENVTNTIIKYKIPNQRTSIKTSETMLMPPCPAATAASVNNKFIINFHILCSFLFG